MNEHCTFWRSWADFFTKSCIVFSLIFAILLIFSPELVFVVTKTAESLSTLGIGFFFLGIFLPNFYDNGGKIHLYLTYDIFIIALVFMFFAGLIMFSNHVFLCSTYCLTIFAGILKYFSKRCFHLLSG